jgi:hypothetical protein
VPIICLALSSLEEIKAKFYAFQIQLILELMLRAETDIRRPALTVEVLFVDHLSEIGQQTKRSGDI